MVNLALWELAGPPVQQALQVPKVPPELQPGDHLESWDQMVHMAPLGRMEIQGNEAGRFVVELCGACSANIEV